MLNSMNCSTVIHLPTIILMLLREATSETYCPRVYSHHINLHHFNLALLFYFAFTFYFASLYQKYQKYYIYQISLS